MKSISHHLSSNKGGKKQEQNRLQNVKMRTIPISLIKIPKISLYLTKLHHDNDIVCHLRRGNTNLVENFIIALTPNTP